MHVWIPSQTSINAYSFNGWPTLLEVICCPVAEGDDHQAPGVAYLSNLKRFILLFFMYLFIFSSRACTEAALLFHAVVCFTFVAIADTLHHTQMLTVVIK